MGIANIMPGVSGGTLAISFGVYDRMIGAVSGIFRDFRKSFQLLFPLLLGMSVGIVCFAYALEYLFTAWPFPTGMAFAGLILGGMPALWEAWKESLPVKGNKKDDKIRLRRLLPGYAILFTGFAAMTVFMSSAHTVQRGADMLQPGRNTLLILFFLGILSAAAMVIPGVSGSLILMISGYYYGILHAVRSLLDGIRTLDIPLLIQNLFLLVPFGTGIVLGIFLFAKLVEYLFRNHAPSVYSAILGLIAASPAAILLQIRTQAPASLKEITAGSAALVFCFFLTKKIGSQSGRN